jgi:hypothetical protein
MNRKGIDVENVNIVPKIKMTEKKNEEMTVFLKGYGLYFGSILNIGDTEEMNFYDYPGGILTGTTISKVVREVNLMDRKLYEVLIRNINCSEGEETETCYFEKNKEGVNWALKLEIVDNVPVMFTDVDKTKAPFSYSSKNDDPKYDAKVVEVTIGETDYGKCLSVFYGWDDGTPAESVYMKNGREILHRRYGSKKAKLSNLYNFEKLPEEGKILHNGEEYRLWYDTVMTKYTN